MAGSRHIARCKITPRVFLLFAFRRRHAACENLRRLTPKGRTLERDIRNLLDCILAALPRIFRVHEH